MGLGTRTREEVVYNIWKTRENCEIEIYAPPTQAALNAAYNPATGKYGTPAETTLWTGSARVQVVRSGEREYLPGADMTAQVYQFQIAPDATVTPDDTMLARVTDGGNQPDLEAYTFHIMDAFNSGESFEKTFYATVNSGR